MNKFKNVMTTWAVVYVLITGLIYVLNQWLAQQPIYIRTFVLSGIMVFVMQYFLFPWIEKLRNYLKI